MCIFTNVVYYLVRWYVFFLIRTYLFFVPGQLVNARLLTLVDVWPGAHRKRPPTFGQTAKCKKFFPLYRKISINKIWKQPDSIAWIHHYKDVWKTGVKATWIHLVTDVGCPCEYVCTSLLQINTPLLSLLSNPLS